MSTLTRDFKVDEFEPRRMRGYLALVLALVPSCYVQYLQSPVAGIAETKSKPLVGTVRLAAYGKEVHWVTLAVHPRHLQRWRYIASYTLISAVRVVNNSERCNIYVIKTINLKKKKCKSLSVHTSDEGPPRDFFTYLMNISLTHTWRVYRNESYLFLEVLFYSLHWNYFITWTNNIISLINKRSNVTTPFCYQLDNSFTLKKLALLNSKLVADSNFLTVFKSNFTFVL